MPVWKHVGKKAGKAWVTGGASLAYDKLKEKRERQAEEETKATVSENAVSSVASEGSESLPVESQTAAGSAASQAPVDLPGAGAGEDQAEEDSAGAEASALPTADSDVAALAAKLRKRVVKALEENLTPGETIVVIIRGAKGQAIVGSATRAFVLKPGFMAGASFGAEVTSWSYRNLAGVQLHKGMMSGSVVLQGPGQSGKRASYWGSGDDDPFKAPNAIPIAGDWNEVKAGVAKLRGLIDVAHNPEQSSAPPATASVADELKKLAELKESGALSEEEFAAAKRRLLEA